MTDWPQQMAREKVYGNFRTRAVKQKRRSTWRQRRPGMSVDHLSLIRKLPCCVSLKAPAGEAHHLKSGTGERGGAMRSTDRWAVPMSRLAHDEVERAGSRNERKWFLDRGVDPHELARSLWEATGDIARMTAIVIANARGLKNG